MKNTEMKDKFEQAIADEPITITGQLEELDGLGPTAASMQWVEAVTTYVYDEKGNISSSTTTTFKVPDKPLYEVFPPLMAFDDGDICFDCDGCDEKEEDEGEEEEENVRYCLSPKGIAMMAAIDAGFVKDIDDEKFELFWSLFHDRMIADGYAEEDDL